MKKKEYEKYLDLVFDGTIIAKPGDIYQWDRYEAYKKEMSDKELLMKDIQKGMHKERDEHIAKMVMWL